ncbi:MAG: hypothetical protein ABI330_00945 [Caldimonas sp.]
MKIKADGSDQAVPGHAYVDQMAVTVKSDSAVTFTNKMAGKVLSTSTQTVSPDGSKLTMEWTDLSGEKPASGVLTESRVAPGPKGSHAISGSWKAEAMPSASDESVTMKFQSKPNGMILIWNGQTTDANFDGKEYPTAGDPGNTMVTLKRLDANTFQETDRRLAKVFDIIVRTVSKDGKTMKCIDTDPVHRTKQTWVMEKQP